MGTDLEVTWSSTYEHNGGFALELWDGEELRSELANTTTTQNVK